MLKTKVMPKGMEAAEVVYNPPAAMACLRARRDDSTSLSECYKPNGPGHYTPQKSKITWFCLLVCFLTKSFGCKNYTNVGSVVTAGLSLCEKDRLEASFI